MAIFEDEGRGFFWGFLLGVGAAVVARQAYSPFRGAVRPLGKAAMRASLTGLEKARDSLALLGEEAEDLMAEVRAEMQAEARDAAASRPGPQDAAASDASSPDAA